jgi:hypothetical protein
MRNRSRVECRKSLLMVSIIIALSDDLLNNALTACQKSIVRIFLPSARDRGW